jgi:adenylate cyclase
MKIEHASSPAEQEAIWRESLTKGHVALKGMRRLMHLLPGAPRCKVCHNPFGGFGGHVCRAIGMTPSRKNPQLCSLCCEKLPPGGAEIETAILFADVRGSTALADRLGPAEFAATMNRFYRVATSTLIRHEATIDKLIGDEVMAFFVPGFAGPDFKRRAIEAGQALLRGVGYGSPDGPWLPVGVGIDAGIAFVGNVGPSGYLDFTALGDPVNTAARIQQAAQPGELLVGEAAFASVAGRFPGGAARDLEVKGKDRTLRVHAVPLGR